MATFNERLLEESDKVLKFFMSQNVSEKVAFLALCMTLARLTAVMNVDPGVVSELVKSYYDACKQAEVAKIAKKNAKLMN